MKKSITLLCALFSMGAIVQAQTVTKKYDLSSAVSEDVWGVQASGQNSADENKCGVGGAAIYFTVTEDGTTGTATKGEGDGILTYYCAPYNSSVSKTNSGSLQSGGATQSGKVSGDENADACYGNYFEVTVPGEYRSYTYMSVSVGVSNTGNKDGGVADRYVGITKTLSAYTSIQEDDFLDGPTGVASGSLEATLSVKNIAIGNAETSVYIVCSNGVRFYSVEVSFYDEGEVTAISSIANDNVVEVARYNIFGQKIETAQKGINIVKYSDGSTQKVLVK